VPVRGSKVFQVTTRGVNGVSSKYCWQRRIGSKKRCCVKSGVVWFGGISCYISSREGEEGEALHFQCSCPVRPVPEKGVNKYAPGLHPPPLTVFATFPVKLFNDDLYPGLAILISPCPKDILMLDTDAERNLQDRIHLLEKHFNIKVTNLNCIQNCIFCFVWIVVLMFLCLSASRFLTWSPHQKISVYARWPVFWHKKIYF